MKQQLLEAAQSHLSTLLELQKRVRRYTGAQVQAGSLLSSAQLIAGAWFDAVKPALQSAHFLPELTDHLSGLFEKLLRLSKTRPRKNVLLGLIDDCVNTYKGELIHQLEIGDFSLTAGLSIAPYIEGLTSDEGRIPS
jgi:hypothetical protein